MAGQPSNGGAKAGAVKTTTDDAQNGNGSQVGGNGNAWSPSSWQSKPMKQSVSYDDEKAVEKALKKLESLPPLVTAAEVSKLRANLEEVALGKAFLLQGGDCAELFDYCTEEKISAKVKLLLQMSMVLIWGGNIPVVRIGRMAGQYAKPRSSMTEIVDGKEVPSFRGDIINGFDLSERTPDPARLVSAYYHSATTLNFLRGQLSSGFADLHHPFEWTLSHVQSSETKEKYQAIVNSITDTIRFMHTIGADTSSSLGTVDLYTSHEGLLLEYEQGLTRLLRDPTDGNKSKWYATSAHFIWIGDRTRQLDCAHVEFFRGIENPIGIKVGPTMRGEELAKLLDIVNPNKEIGKVTLITRYGADKVNELLPGHIEAVVQAGHTVDYKLTIQCSYRNTRSAPTGVKTRQFDNIMIELSNAHNIHQKCGTHLGGVHLELTADAVTECVGGSENLTDDDLSLNYTTYCDPRLNNKQALEAAFMIAAWYREKA
ncbi:DAHP synthetase [Choiromyces venosus 120613-1]|uniref:Phospho-2-dehydro-3-deoxyheptonate aldolase n=1 Tax=Choiromyces venosus 120613-1 TaxID=1336337 RepID=A0A3N4JLY1_9PEZI|nr:DAHP synthetase [Choiromyces venosus 120613-1]